MSNTTAGLCPKLNNMWMNPQIITASNFKSLRLDSYNRSVGAVVKVSCTSHLQLYGSPSVKCQGNLKWTSQPRCDYPPNPAMSEKTKLIVSLSTISGLLAIVTLVAILFYLIRDKKEKENDNYKHGYINESEFYRPKVYLPSSQRNANIHMNPITLPQNKSQWEVMESTLSRLPSMSSLDAPSNFQKKRYDFEEFNVYALRQGRDPFLWRPVVANMHFEN